MVPQTTVAKSTPTTTPTTAVVAATFAAAPTERQAAKLVFAKSPVLQGSPIVMEIQPMVAKSISTPILITAERVQRPVTAPTVQLPVPAVLAESLATPTLQTATAT